MNFLKEDSWYLLNTFMKKQDLESLQESYQQIEEGLLNRVTTRVNSAKNALMGKRSMDPAMEIAGNHAEDIAKDLQKMNIIPSNQVGALYGELREVILNSIDKHRGN